MVSEPTTEVSRDTIELEYQKDPGGPVRKASLNATIISSPLPRPIIQQQSQKVPIKKAGESEVSQATDDEDLIAGIHQILDPPYDLEQLAGLMDVSTELGKDVWAMVTNTVGFGWQLQERYMEEDTRDKYAKEIAGERVMLDRKLMSVHPFESITMIRKKEIFDKHILGNGYLELIENKKGDLVGVSHVYGYQVRLVKKDEEPTKIKVPIVVAEDGYTVQYVDMYYRFRRFVIERVDGRVIWFKEAGDPRVMNKRTGERYPAGSTEVREVDRATSLIHNKVYHPKTPYGVPFYIGASVCISGSRSSEEVNYNSIENNMVPSMFVIVENGQLTDKSIERLKEFAQEKISKQKNRTAFIIIEGETSEEGAPDPAKFRITVEPLASAQHNDQLYQEYDKNNCSKVRQTFRLPSLLVGVTDTYNRSTSDNAKAIADEQVFAPERDDNDHLFNRHVLLRWGARFHELKSNHPNITDDVQLIRLMGIAERSGGMTPRRADRIVKGVFGPNIGPLPKNIDLDVPFSITFAEAQSTPPAGGEQGLPDGTETPNNPSHPEAKSLGSVDPDILLKSLMDLRSQIEKELDAEFEDDDIRG